MAKHRTARVAKRWRALSRRALTGLRERARRRGLIKKRRRWGSLYRYLGISLEKKIPLKLLRRAAKRKGVVGRRARFKLRARGYYYPI